MAGLHVYRSNRLEALVAFLASQLQRGSGDPLVEREVVVGSRGMERHLRHALAEQIGICAHIRFPFPVAALDGVSREAPGADPWDVGPLTWALLEVLPEVAAGEHGGPLRRYLEAGAGPVEALAHGLAHRVADTFDRYVTYRPELATAWSEGEGTPLPDGQRWQRELWTAVHAHLQAAPHRAQRLADLELPAPTDEPLHVFGLSSLAPSWLTALARVARQRPVELYLLSPSSGYWADLRRRLTLDPAIGTRPPEEVRDALRDPEGEAGHPLLMSWGRSARDLQILLESLPDGFEEGRTDLFLEPGDGGPSRALHLLQADILAGTHPAQRDLSGRALGPDDRSVQIHACHGPTRQVEVLRTALLELLDADPSLQPRDIVVMTPDIDRYAPLIRAIFDGGAAGPGPDGWPDAPRLPCEIADLAVRRVNPVADALLSVLEMVDGRAGADAVLDLLALPPVGARFGVDADGLAELRGWVVGSGIRWGADAAHREDLGQPADLQNTWRFGLDRLIFGTILADDGRLPAGVRPFEAVEGGGVRALGRLAELCATLFEQLERLKAPRSLERWADALDEAVTALTETTADEAWLTRSVRETLEGLREEGKVARSARPVALDALRAALTGRFEVTAGALQGLGGAITFCGMVPERAVPYRVVCLLGMDEGSFPRVGTRPAFDLTQHPRRVGDREPRDEDRYLLLEALLSARDHLVVLYTGRDVHTGEVRPPAVPVSELCDALDATFPAEEVPASERLTRVHPLAAFDPRNFRAEGPVSYDRRLLEAVRAGLGARRSPEPFLWMGGGGEAAVEEVTDLADLVAFWRHPIRAFLQRRLRMWLPRGDEEVVPDREPVELGHWDRGDLLAALLQARGQDPAEVRRTLRASGQLPLGAAGDVAVAEVAALAEAMTAEAEALGWQAEAVGGADLDAVVGATRLVGRVDGCLPGALVRFRYGRESARELLEAWIALMAWRASDPQAPRRAVVVFGRLKESGELEVQPMGLEVEEDDLAPLVVLRSEGLAGPLPYLSRCSHAVAKALCKGLPEDWQDPERLTGEPWPEEVADVASKAAGEGLDAWYGGYSSGECQGRYCRHAFGEQPPFLDGDALRPDFAALALTVWAPVLRARKTARVVQKWEVR